MARTLVVRLAANALGEDVEEFIGYIEETYPVRDLQREPAQLMFKFEEDVGEESIDEVVKQEFGDVVSGELEWS